MGRGTGVRIVGEDAIQLDFRWKGRRRIRLRLTTTKANVLYCERWKRRIEDEIARGEFVWEKHFPDHENPCPDQTGTKLLDAMLAYVESLEGQVQPETLTEYKHDAETLARGLNNPALEKLTRAELRTYVSTQRLSKSRLDSLLRPLRGTLRQAVEDEVLPKNPLQGFVIKRADTGGREAEIDPFTPDEIAALGRVRSGDLWTIWAWTGPRSGEIIGLRVGDVDLEAGVMHIRRAVRRGRKKPPKTESGIRTITLLAPAKSRLALLVAGREPHEPLFINPRTGRDWHEAKALNREFTRACKAADVRRRYSYQLRHTYATWALSAGENPAWIATQLGHASVEELYETYGRWMQDLDPDAGSRMLGAVFSKARRGQSAA